MENKKLPKQIDSNSRILHYLIDQAIILIPIYFFGSSIFESIEVSELTENAITISVYLMAYAIYFIPTEYIFQKSLGKFISRKKIVDKDGNKPKLINIVIRTFARSIPFDPLSYLVMNRGFHDRLAGTYVINDSDAK